MRLLIADDDQAVSRFLLHGLQQDGFEVTLAADGETAIETARREPPDLAVLDLNLPRRDGTEVLAVLRSLAEDFPVLVLTARTEPGTRLQCLRLGADDFMEKPFSLAELRARCQALLRRRTPGLVLRCGVVEMNRVERSVRCAGDPVTLTNREFALLEYLLLHRGHAIARATLLDQIWNAHPQAGTNVVDVYINYLRHKLHDERHAPDGSPPPLIRTVRGVGYAIGLES